MSTTKSRNYSGNTKLTYIISYARPDATNNSPYGFLASFGSKIQTKLLTLAREYYRIGSADVQANIMLGKLCSAANVIEGATGITAFPKSVHVDYSRFPFMYSKLDLPVGPILLNDATALAAMTLKYTTESDSPLANSLKISIDDDASSDSVVRLRHDGCFPSLTVRSGQVWPTPLYGEFYPVRFSSYVGLFNPDFWDANTVDVIYATYGPMLDAIFMLGLHLYETRIPVTDKTMTEIPYSMQLYIRGLGR